VSCVRSYNLFCPFLILDVPFTCGRDYMYFWPCLVPHVKLGNWYSILFGSIGTHLKDDSEEKNWDRFD
jgi:hypothetical protein